LKGQIQQVFIYILTIIVVGLILLVGYKAIINIMEKSCDVETTKFASSLEESIGRYTDSGSFHTVDLKAPCETLEVCFVDPDTTSINSGYAIIDDSVNAGIKQNIFLIKPGLIEPFGYFPSIDVQSNILCVENTNGFIRMSFEGLGQKTRVTVEEVVN
jgi:hypothetical protein